MNKIVGVIGGMGPAATAYFFSKVIEKTDASCDGEHIHILIDNNPQIPDRTASILRNGISPVPAIIESGQKLVDAGADFLVIPCNTSHYYYDEIQKAIDAPIINMVVETAKKCLQEKKKCVGILATEGTVKSDVYKRQLEEFGISVVYPEEDEQSVITDIIYNQIKANKDVDINSFKWCLDKISRRGVDTFVLGCTELPLIMKDFEFGYQFIDTLSVLVDATIAYAGYKSK